MMTQSNKFTGIAVLTVSVLLALLISGLTVYSLNAQEGGTPTPIPTPVNPYPLTNAIRNGDFELFSTGNNNSGNAVADHWQSYHNDGAHFAWYDEQWPEAVHSGSHSQLMEIFRVESFKPERVMAIYQTVNVIPHMDYLLTIHAIMRSDGHLAERNQGAYAMHWGIDTLGRGKDYYVENWVKMPLDEQQRLGSNGPQDDNTHLYFQAITHTIRTGSGNKLTLFIRGMKVEPTGTELNFNIDDVSLLGPYIPPTPTLTPSPTLTRYPTSTPTATPTQTPPPPEPALPVTGAKNADSLAGKILPDAGGILPVKIPAGVLLLGGVVLVALGAVAAHNLLQKRKK
jgi:phage terminase large subunit-like protein